MESCSAIISSWVMEKIPCEDLLDVVDLALFSLNKAANELLENWLEFWEVILLKMVWFGLCFVKNLIK